MTRPQRCCRLRLCLRLRIRLSSLARVYRTATTKQSGDKQTEQQVYFHRPFLIRIYWHFCDAPQGAGVRQSTAETLTNFRTFAGKTTLPKPWKVAAHVCYALKPKSLNCLGANVRDCFFNRIRRINQL